MNRNTLRSGRLTAVAGLSALAVVASIQGAATAAPNATAGAAGTIEMVALHNADDAQASAKSSTNGSATVASADGRYVVFSTEAPLVRRDTNRLDDVYLRDTQEGRTVLVSTDRAGALGNDYSVEPSISSDGRFAAFTTWATNLFDDHNGHVLDVVVKDMRTGRLRLVSARADGTQTRRNSFFPVISGNGRHVAFQTFGSFRKTDADRREDVYVKNRRTGAVHQATLDRNGKDLPGHYVVGGISADGGLVTFGDDNSAWVHDVDKRQTTRFWHEPNHPDSPFPAGTVGRPVISGDGRFVAFSTRNEFVVDGDEGFYSDIFRLDLVTGHFEMVTVAVDGGPADEESFIPSLSRTGRYVGFSSFASNLVAGDSIGSDTFVRDMRTGTTMIASTGPDGPGNHDSGRNAVAISANGRALVYESYASNLVAGDTNRQPEVFMWRAGAAD
jgi:Tol biopolymer transport system component